jgi:predicted SnoaL-like aldol condensation-catalyzing enzyme
MKLSKTLPKTLLATALVAALPALAAVPAAAQMRALSDPVVPHPDPESLFSSSDPVLHRNKQAALHIQRNLLKCNEWSRASEWLTDAYIQHNPVAASGLPGVVYYFTQIAQRQPLSPCPALSADDPNGVVAVQAEGDYVTILTRRIVPYADDPTQTYTTTWFDTWRFVDGKADEHWDPATLPPAPAPALDPNRLLMESQVRSEVEQLMWDYVRAADTLNADAYAALFTEDGRFNDVAGRDALRGMINGMAESQTTRRREGAVAGNMHHIMSNQTIEVLSPTRARVHYYWQTVFGGPGITPTPRVAAVGNGVDDVVKVEGRWLIMSRNVQPTREQE